MIRVCLQWEIEIDVYSSAPWGRIWGLDGVGHGHEVAPGLESLFDYM